MRPHAGGSVDPQKDVRREESAKEHHFGRQKKPDTDLRVPKTGVGAIRNCVWNFHDSVDSNELSWHKFFGRLATRSLSRCDGLILHGEIAFATRQAVFIGAT